VPVSICRPRQQTARRSDSGWPRKRRFFDFGRFRTFPKIRLSNGRNIFTTANIETIFGTIAGDGETHLLAEAARRNLQTFRSRRPKTSKNAIFSTLDPPGKFFRRGIGPVVNSVRLRSTSPVEWRDRLEEMSSNKGT
jgi:hypothetical protein